MIALGSPRAWKSGSPTLKAHATYIPDFRCWGFLKGWGFFKVCGFFITYWDACGRLMEGLKTEEVD
jgi:hypothetical protein